MTLEPKSFYPPPKVRSAVVVLDPRDPGLASPREDVLDLVSTSFRMRRKKLVNNLTGWRELTREQVLRRCSDAGIDENARAETLALADFDRLVQERNVGRASARPLGRGGGILRTSARGGGLKPPPYRIIRTTTRSPTSRTPPAPSA